MDTPTRDPSGGASPMAEVIEIERIRPEYEASPAKVGVATVEG
jgi:hypothetical protein